MWLSGPAIMRFACVVMTAWIISAECPAQAPYAPPSAPQAPVVPPAAPVQPPQAPGVPVQPQPVPRQSDSPLEYAFRPDLTNPEFGQCLNLERQWQALWQRYYQLYSQVRMMNPADPQYAQTTYYATMVKSQLDTAWNEFSGKCVYFPKR
ncbi:MAG: hypothetical protein V1792_01335 [Pseudomonadota bacterium]